MTTIDRAGLARDLEWTETFTERGDGFSDVTGWEAATPFGTYYSVEMGFGSDSFCFTAKHDYDLISDRDDADSAKADAQAHFEKAIAAALRQPDQKGEATDLLARAEKAEQAVRWCRSRLKTDAYRTTLDKHLTLPPGPLLPENERLVRSAPQPAPEAGKLPSEEALSDRVLARWRYLDDTTGWPLLRRIIDEEAALLSPAQSHDVPCARCAGTSWVCENHPDKAWTAEGCECGAGMPCPDCDQRRQPQPHDVPAGGGGDGDHPRIWLEPKADSYGCEGRLWCQDDVWEGGVEYVRASRATSGRA